MLESTIKNKKSKWSIIIICYRGNISCLFHVQHRTVFLFPWNLIYLDVYSSWKKEKCVVETSMFLQASSWLCEEFSPTSDANQAQICLWSELSCKCFQAMSHRWTRLQRKNILNITFTSWVFMAAGGIESAHPHHHNTACLKRLISYVSLKEKIMRSLCLLD